jgi:biotin operon repressor
MGKVKVLELTEAQRLELESGFRKGEKHCFRMRCRAVLLKADGLSAAKAGAQTEMSFVSVNALVKRYKEEGIEGHTKMISTNIRNGYLLSYSVRCYDLWHFRLATSLFIP